MGSLRKGENSRERRANRRSIAGVVAIAAMLAGLLALGAQPSAAATTTKKINATCGGADAATTATLAALGGSLTTPVTVTAEAPAFVEPEQTGVPISMTVGIALDAATVNTVAAISPSLKVSNVRAPLTVSGPTSTTSINATLADQTLKLTAGQPFNASFPGITGELNDIGTGGLIKVTTTELTFSITLTSGPLTDPLNLRCTTGATVLSIPVKVAGSPDIVQPIEVPSVAGQPVTVDVLSQYVTNGRTKDGVEQQVDPSTLKILEGDAQIVDGKVVATGPAAGESSEVTFEVCAGTIKIADATPGETEVQEIRLFLDTGSQALKREMGTRFGFAGESADEVVWSMDFLPQTLFTKPNPPKDEEVEEGKDSWWQRNVNNYILNPHTWPTAAEMQAGLESIPSIGPGNVTVTRGDIVSNGRGNVPEGVTLKAGMQYRPYVVTFSGELANKALDQFTVANLYSFLPSEIKAQLIALAGSLGGDGEGDGEGEPGEEPTPIPEGLTAKEYVDQLSAEAGRRGAAGDIAGQIETIQLMFKVIGENIGDLIDVNEVTALLNDLFQPNPEVVTLTQGEDPTPEQFQELCSQGIISLTSASVESATTVPPGGGAGGPGATVQGATLRPAG